jgi:hypothetical protein
MSLHPDMRERTVAPKTVEQLRRAPRPIHPPQWLLPVAVLMLAGIAAIIGISLLRSDDTTTTAFEPLIVPEEQAFIDAHTAELPRAATAQSPDYSPSLRPTGIAGMIGYYESEYILNRVPQALLPSPASVGFPQVVGPEEASAIDTRVGPLVARTPLVQISERPQGIPGVIDYYELEYIQTRTPFSLAPSPASVGFPQVTAPEEQAFVDGEYVNESVEDWCLTHTPC